jgi:hypothetical protein
MLDETRVLEALLHEDLASFIAMSFRTLEAGTDFRENWHNLAFAHQLTRVANGELTRLILTVPPRSGKSISASAAYPAWVLGRHPSLKIMCVSYASDLAHTNATNFRTII